MHRKRAHILHSNKRICVPPVCMYVTVNVYRALLCMRKKNSTQIFLALIFDSLSPSRSLSLAFSHFSCISVIAPTVQMHFNNTLHSTSSRHDDVVVDDDDYDLNDEHGIHVLLPERIYAMPQGNQIRRNHLILWIEKSTGIDIAKIWSPAGHNNIEPKVKRTKNPHHTILRDGQQHQHQQKRHNTHTAMCLRLRPQCAVHTKYAARISFILYCMYSPGSLNIRYILVEQNSISIIYHFNGKCLFKYMIYFKDNESKIAFECGMKMSFLTNCYDVRIHERDQCMYSYQMWILE